MLFQPAGDGAHEVLAAGLAFPVVGFAAGGVVGEDVVGGVLEDDFGHGWWGWVCVGMVGSVVRGLWWFKEGRKKEGMNVGFLDG